MKLTFTDDQGHVEEIDFDGILCKDDEAPNDSAHARVMRALADLPPGEERSAILKDIERQNFVSFMLDRIALCQKCEAHVLHSHAWVNEKDDLVCDRCEAPPAAELKQRRTEATR